MSDGDSSNRHQLSYWRSAKKVRNESRSLVEHLAIAYTLTAVVTANDDNEGSPTGGVAAVLMALEYLAELFEDYRWDPYLLVRLSH